ncbi:hypothetical protein PHMEG_00016955 [Phytophthora megakarya]|uniref:Uncharacterized protein n=1 Tax=Phytophthora megakarya TaxID=4795 RepID=A0A225VZ30_9STRA|nr:hypothetical protein PHMEG_00016955 [Phytophthora megakarya]
MPKTGGNEASSSNRKKPVTTKPMSTESGKCNPMRCFEKGHTKDKCWVLHPELRPALFKDGGGKRAGAAAVTSATGSTGSHGESNKMWSDGVSRPNTAIAIDQNQVFDSATKANRMYFLNEGRKNDDIPERYLIKTI